MLLTGAVAALLSAGLAQAQQTLISDLSFGYAGRYVRDSSGNSFQGTMTMDLMIGG